MKTLKIIIALIFVALIASLIILSTIKKNKIVEIKEPTNSFISNIIDEIEELKTKSDLFSSKKLYDEIAYHLDESYQKNRLGNSLTDNELQKTNLERDLYSTFINQFIFHTKNILSKSEWDPNIIKFIQAEKNQLITSPFLDSGSPVDMELRTIQKALNKYYEIVNFIDVCKSFNYTDTKLKSRFPVDTAKIYINRSATYLHNNLENTYVNNCTSLRIDLENIPQLFFYKHVLYLDNKIDFWSQSYSEYGTHKDYSNLLYNPLKSEIEELENSLYNAQNYDIEYKRLKDKWRDDNNNAYYHNYQ